MKREWMIMAVNLGVLLLYMVLVRHSVTGQEKWLSIMIYSGFLIMGQVLLNLILATVYRQYRKGFLLSALLVLLIGFSTCFFSA